MSVHAMKSQLEAALHQRCSGRVKPTPFRETGFLCYFSLPLCLLQMFLLIVKSPYLFCSFEVIYKQIGISVPGPILPSRSAAERPINLYEGFFLGALASPASRPAMPSHLPFLYSSFGLVETRSTDSGKPSPLGALGGDLSLICASAAKGI